MSADQVKPQAENTEAKQAKASDADVGGSNQTSVEDVQAAQVSEQQTEAANNLRADSDIAGNGTETPKVGEEATAQAAKGADAKTDVAEAAEGANLQDKLLDDSKPESLEELRKLNPESLTPAQRAKLGLPAIDILDPRKLAMAGGKHMRGVQTKAQDTVTYNDRDVELDLNGTKVKFDDQDLGWTKVNTVADVSLELGENVKTEKVEGVGSRHTIPGDNGNSQVIEDENGALHIRTADGKYKSMYPGDDFSVTNRAGRVVEGDAARNAFEALSEKMNVEGTATDAEGALIFNADGQSTVKPGEYIQVSDQDAVINHDGKPLVTFDDSDYLGAQSGRVMVDIPAGSEQTTMEGLGTRTQVLSSDGSTTDLIQTENGTALVKKGDEYFSVSKDRMVTGDKAKELYESYASKFDQGNARIVAADNNPNVRAEIKSGSDSVVQVGANNSVNTDIPDSAATITNESGTLARLENGAQLVKTADGTTIRNSDGSLVSVSSDGQINEMTAGAEATAAWKEVSEKFETAAEPKGGDGGIEDKESWNPVGLVSNVFETAASGLDSVIQYGADMVGLGEEWASTSESLEDWYFGDYDYDATIDNIVEASADGEVINYSEDQFEGVEMAFDLDYLSGNESVIPKSDEFGTWYSNTESGDVTLIGNDGNNQLFREDGSIITQVESGGYIVQDKSGTVSVSDGKGGEGRIVTDDNGDTVFQVERNGERSDVRVGKNGEITKEIGGEEVTIHPNGAKDFREHSTVLGGRAEALRRALEPEQYGRNQTGSDGSTAVVDDHGQATSHVERCEKTGRVTKRVDLGKDRVSLSQNPEGGAIATINGAGKPIHEMSPEELQEHGIKKDGSLYTTSSGRQFTYDGKSFKILAEVGVPEGYQGPPLIREIELFAPDQKTGEVKVGVGGEIITANKDGKEGETEVGFEDGSVLTTNPEGLNEAFDPSGQKIFSFNHVTGDYESPELSFNSNNPVESASFFGGTVNMSDAYFGTAGYNGGRNSAEAVAAREEAQATAQGASGKASMVNANVKGFAGTGDLGSILSAQGGVADALSCASGALGQAMASGDAHSISIARAALSEALSANSLCQQAISIAKRFETIAGPLSGDSITMSYAIKKGTATSISSEDQLIADLKFAMGDTNNAAVKKVYGDRSKEENGSRLLT